MKFVNEEYDLSGRGSDFFEHCLESIFEFAAEFCSRDQRSHVQCHDAFIAQALRDVIVNDPQRQPFGDRRFSDARLADQDGIILTTTRQNLDHSPNFLVATDDWIELASLSGGDKVDAELFKGLVFCFRILIGNTS